MDEFKRLISEAHRRSLWQVLTLYLAMSWGALEVVRAIVESANLPEWLPALALVLLIIGLPVVVATAFVQEGAPRMGTPSAPPSPRQDDGDAAHGTSAGPVSSFRRHSLFTWRNALVGGVGAFALWGLVAAFLVSTGRPVGPSGLSASDRPAIAVLPLEALAVAGGEGDAFSRGFHDEIITRLSKVSGLRVTSRTSVMQYAGQALNMRDIARELGVDLLLEGSVQRTEDRLALNIQLIDGRTDEHVWAESYERPYDLKGVFGLQRQLAEEIVGALRASLTPEEATGLAEVPTSNPDAYQTYLQANEFYWSGPRSDDFDTAIDLYERAVEQDSSFALAHALLAFAIGQWWQVHPGGRTEAVRQQAREAVERARELNPDLPELFLAEAQLHYALDGNWGLALAALNRASGTGLKSDYYHLLGAAQRRAGDWEGGLETWREMVRVDPLSSHYHEDLGTILAATGRHDEAVAELRRAIELDPKASAPHNFLIEALPQLHGDTEAAWRAVEAAEDATGEAWRWWRAQLHYLDRKPEAALSTADGPLQRAFLLHLLGRLDEAATTAGGLEEEWQSAPLEERQQGGPGRWLYGAEIAEILQRPDEAARRVEEALRLRTLNPDAVQGPHDTFRAARLLARTGHTDRAFSLLEELRAGAGEPTPRFIAMHPDFDGLRDEPRFVAVVGEEPR